MFYENKKIKLSIVACCVALFSFLIGVSVDRLLSDGKLTFRTITRRDFDYCDRSWQDLAEEYSTSHDVALGKVNATQIDTYLK